MELSEIGSQKRLLQFVAAGAVIADGSAGFSVTRTAMTVATIGTVTNMVSYMHESENAMNPEVKKELETKAKESAADLLVTWEQVGCYKQREVCCLNFQRLGLVL
ncbi:hypothetical protein AB6805_14775 [Chitinophaga sp. RCC_12]|uniref:hypothetical protein n=1 Tax=Chitinophaga sp. RCC_12 TaxID=3239226 RepID=UPI0035247978